MAGSIPRTKDVERDAFLAGEGYRVMRFWNNDVLSNRDGVLTLILQALEQEQCTGTNRVDS
jgi:very-short-patch-repair endonuclease